jgi:uncharacterized protein
MFFDSFLQKPKTPEKKTLGLGLTSAVFSICVFLYLYWGSFIQKEPFLLSLLLTQLFVILSPPLLALKWFGLHLKTTLRLNKVSLYNLSLSLWIHLMSLPLIILFNAFWILFWRTRENFSKLPTIPIAQNGFQLFLFILTFGLVVGVCEEVLFRGFLQKGFETLGVRQGIILSSVLFSFMHLSFLKLPSTFFLSLIIAFAVYRTNSIYTGIFLHFFNNTLSTFLLYLIQRSAPQSPSMTNSASLPFLWEALTSFEKSAFVSFTLLSILLITTLCFFSLKALILTFIDATKDCRPLAPSTVDDDALSQTVPKANKKELLWLLPGLWMILNAIVNDILSL